MDVGDDQLGGQHRYHAIKEALDFGVDEWHGVKICLDLTTEQRLDAQLISNTVIVISSDLFDRMHETVNGPQLRKRFLELAGEALEDDGVTANLHAGMVLAFCALEAHINAVSDEMALQKGLTAHEKSILLEREVSLDSGHYKLKNALKMYRLEDRILFLFARFGKSTLNKNSPWWAKLKASSKVRNEISHPKQVTKLAESGEKLANLLCADRAEEQARDSLRHSFAALHRAFPAGGLDSIASYRSQASLDRAARQHCRAESRQA